MAKVTPSINFSTSMFLEILTVEAHIRQRMLVPILAFEGTVSTIKNAQVRGEETHQFFLEVD